MFILWLAFFVLIIGAPLFTCLIEIPIQLAFKTTSNIKLLAGINFMTNYLFNIVFCCVSMFSYGETTSWTLISEFIWIPVVEGAIISYTSRTSKTKIYLVSFLANFASYGLGYLAIYLLNNIFSLGLF